MITTETTPPLKWAGGKRWLIKYLIPFWIKHSSRRLAEPFCGGLAVSLGLKPEKALLNDYNVHLINFYRHLKSGLSIELPMENDRELFYQYRHRFNELLQSGFSQTSEAASLFYYLNRTCYNGLCRFNRQGYFNVPFGSYKKITYQKDFSVFKNQFINWQFSSADFEAMAIEPDDFIYADPPYDVPFTQYADKSFTWDDQVRLAYWLTKHKGPVILSNQATERVVELYQKTGYRISYLTAPRRISSKKRIPAREVLAMRNL